MQSSITRLAVLSAAFSLAVGLAACGDNAGSAQRSKGEVKEAVGGLTGDAELKREGKTDQAVGGVKDAAHDAGESVKDAVK